MALSRIMARMVGYALATYARTVGDKLAEAVSIKDFASVGNGEDATSAFQLAANGYKRVLVPAGTYVISSVTLSASVTFVCEPGAVFLSKAGTAVASAGYLSEPGMFLLQTNGISVRFEGAPTFDGNYLNQTAVEPGGAIFKVTPPATPTSGTVELYIENGRFQNGVSDYLMLRGDDVNRRYLTRVTLVNPTFTGGVYGKGKGDPSTPTALGYTPAYIRVLDYVTLRTYDFKASYDAALSLGQYAPVAIWGTFAGADYTTSGNASILMYGRTHIEKMGRASWKYNDQNEYTTNNGIGCIDGYGSVDEIYIEDIKAVNCYFAVVRAKGSCRMYTVKRADLQNCIRGLQVGPSSTGPCRTVVNVSAFTSYGGTIPQLEFNGSSSTDMLNSIDVSGAYCYGTYTNPEALVNQGLIVLANAAKANVRGLAAIGSPSNAIAVTSVDRTYLSEVITNSTGLSALRVSGTGQLTLEKFDLRSSGSYGVFITPGMADVQVRGGRIDTTVDYGIINQGTGNITVQSVSVSNVSGQSRGFYNAGGYANMLGNIANVGVTVPLFYVAGVVVREHDNSWNRREVYGTISATSNGTWGVGDVVWNNSAATGVAMGWVCTTAGSGGSAVFRPLPNVT